MEQAQRHYEQLHKRSREARTLSSVAALLDWDHETYMPSDGAGIRAEQLELLAGIIHAKKTGKPFASSLAKLINIETGQVLAPELNEAQRAALREWRRDYLLDKALPKRFVEKLAKLTSQAMNVWRHARQQDAFQQFAPYLDQLVKMQRKKAEYFGYKEHPYDALLNQYEHGATTAEISTLFSSLRSSLTPFIKQVAASQSCDDHFLFGTFDQEQQLKFSRELLKEMQYDMKKGRLDLSAHPFSTSMHPSDSRITTRIHPTGLFSNISAVMHETGHALYEMNLPAEHYGSPLGEAISLGMHESQSRWWETLIGHSKPFWQRYLPLLKQHFKSQLDHVSLDAFYRAINKVNPSYIRIEADEATYGLHVILRFELERALIEGSLKVRDVPEAWNAQMKDLLGVTPPTNREGCLQDIHWAMGAFGYFPTYTLGNLYASHLFLGFARDFPNWKEKLTAEGLGFIKEWLAKSVHRHGRRYTSKELLQQVAGKPFSADAFIQYLTGKYGELCKTSANRSQECCSIH